ncbi:MAG: tRNA pseudouridine(55) synthase TruB [Peptococcaceae bacterium]
MDGVINIFKHSGVSSHDIVQSVRKSLGIRKVGHTGTLDPDAVGVLPICIGKATRLVEYLTSTTKGYRALLRFGAETDTQDASGEITKETEFPTADFAEFKNVLEKFKGEIEQVPPMYSALKVAGQPLYQLARQGKEITREPRKITIYDIKIISYTNEAAIIDVICSKGTYIRTLCQDIGRALNSSAYMSFLLRTRSGIFELAESFTIDELTRLPLESFLIKPADSLKDWPLLKVSDQELKRIINGNQIELKGRALELPQNKMYKVVENNELLAVGLKTDHYFKPVKVFR